MPKRIQGVVTSDTNMNRVRERRFTHPVLKKPSKSKIPLTMKERFQVGDLRIIECAPKSKTKRWEVLKPRPSGPWRLNFRSVETTGGYSTHRCPIGREKPHDPDANKSGCC